MLQNSSNACLFQATKRHGVFVLGNVQSKNANLLLVQIKGFAEFIDDFGRHR